MSEHSGSPSRNLSKDIHTYIRIRGLAGGAAAALAAAGLRFSAALRPCCVCAGPWCARSGRMRSGCGCSLELGRPVSILLARGTVWA